MKHKYPTSAVSSKVNGQGCKVTWSVWQVFAWPIRRERKVPKTSKLLRLLLTSRAITRTRFVVKTSKLMSSLYNAEFSFTKVEMSQQCFTWSDCFILAANTTVENAQLTNRIAKLENEGKRCLQKSWFTCIVIIIIIIINIIFIFVP